MYPLEFGNTEERERQAGPAASGRREFLKQVGTAPVALAAAGVAYGAAAVAETHPLPQIRLGEHSVSRLICGDNPFKANSHLSVSLNQHMRRYYTPDQIVKTLRRCEQVGINCWQASFAGELDLHRRYIAEGGKMQLIVIEAGTDIIAKAKDAGAIGVAHQGEATDHLFKSGQLDKVHEFLKQVRQAGMLVGVSTHMPAVVDAIESKGWDVDYYMTCVYERNRSAEELKKLLDHVPIPVSEVYLTEDPPRMFQAIRHTRRPCLAFKILAAGRCSWHREWVERAFRQTFQSIKPTDAVIVGMYNEFNDEPAENAELVRRYGS
ncbi:MAG: hypothetical protein NTY19_40955 [Planctomycetota bacterium]|nr:hypothetical protein [Planctomycetota bacterium]